MASHVSSLLQRPAEAKPLLHHQCFHLTEIISPQQRIVSSPSTMTGTKITFHGDWDWVKLSLVSQYRRLLLNRSPQCLLQEVRVAANSALLYYHEWGLQDSSSCLPLCSYPNLWPHGAHHVSTTQTSPAHLSWPTWLQPLLRHVSPFSLCRT